MLSDPNVESFVTDHTSTQIHFIQQIKRKNAAYAIQIVSLSVSLILSLVVAVLQQTIIQSMRFLVVATVEMTLHAFFIIFIENHYDVHCQHTSEFHSIKSFTITYKPCACFISTISNTIHMLNTLGCLSSLGYLVILNMYTTDSLAISIYAFLSSYLITNSPVPTGQQSYFYRTIQVVVLLIFISALVKALKGSTLIILLISILFVQTISSHFSSEQLNKRPLQLIRDSQVLQLLSNQFIAKTFSNLLPHRALDYLLQDRDIRLQVHANMYLLVINIDIAYFRMKLQKHMCTSTGMHAKLTSSNAKIPPLTDCYTNHIIASIINQFISCIDTILLDDFPQLTKVYSNLDTIKVIAGESFTQYNNRQNPKHVEFDTGSAEPKDYMKILSTFALLVSKCAEIFSLRVDSVITFGDLAIGFMGSYQMSCYEVFGAPVALATKLYEKIVMYNQDETRRSESSATSDSQSYKNDSTWSQSTTSTNSASLISSNRNALTVDDHGEKPFAYSSKSHSTKCSLSLSKDSPSCSAHEPVPLYSDIDPPSFDNKPSHTLSKGTGTDADPHANILPPSGMSFSQANQFVTESLVDFIELPSNVYFSVVNMLSRPLEEYGNRGTEGSDTITSDVVCSDILSDDPQPLTNTDLESSMNFRRFLAARRGNTRAAFYSKRRSVIKALNTTTSPTDDKFPQKLIFLNQHSDSNSSMHHRHKARSRSSTTPQTVAFNSTFFYSSSSTNSMRLWSPKNLKIDALYVNNALNQLSYPSSSKASSPNLQEVCDVKMSINQISLDGLSAFPLVIEYPSRITHKHRNFLFYKPPLYMFYNSIKLTLSGSSLSSNSSVTLPSHHSLGMLSFTNHNYSLIVCLLAFGLKYRILVAEQGAAQKNKHQAHCIAKSEEHIQSSASGSIDHSVGEVASSSRATHDTLSFSECTDTRVSSASVQKDEKLLKYDCWDADTSYQLLLQTDESILRAKDPKSSAYRALNILDSIPIYNSRAMRKLFRLLNTDLERFDRVITSLNKSLLPQSKMCENSAAPVNTNLDFNSLVANAGLFRAKKQHDNEWSSLLREVKMTVIKNMDNTMDFHSCPDHDSSHISSVIYPLSGDPTFITTSSDSQSASVVTPVLDSVATEHLPFAPASSNVLSTQNLSDSRATNLYMQNSQLLPSNVMAPENLPIPGQQNSSKSKSNDLNLKALMTIVSRKAESFDSSGVNIDSAFPIHYFKRRSYSYVDFSANKLDVLYSNIGRKSTAHLATNNFSLLEHNQEPKEFNACLRNSQINELKTFSQALGKRIHKANANRNKLDSPSGLTSVHYSSPRPPFHNHADDNAEIPLFTLKSPSVEHSFASDSGAESLPETPKSVASHLPTHRSTLSHICKSISPSSGVDEDCGENCSQKKNSYSLARPYGKANKVHATTLQESDDSMHALSLVRESDQSDSTDNLSDIQFSRANPSMLSNITDKAPTAVSEPLLYPLPAGPSAHLKTVGPNTPSFGGLTEGTSNPPTAMDSYSCLYKLGIASENDETENSVQSVVLYNGSMHLPDAGEQDTVPMSVLAQLPGGKNTMGGNPRPIAKQLSDLHDGTVTSLSITSCTDSPRNRSIRSSISLKSKVPSYKQSSYTDGLDDDVLFNPHIWQTDSFITLVKPATGKPNINNSNTVNATGRSIETSFHATTSHAFKDMVATRTAPTPAYTPANLLNITQYKSIVYATFGVAFDLVARPSICISSVPSVRPVFSSSSLQSGPFTDSKKNYENITAKSKTGDVPGEDRCTASRPNTDSDAAQESLIQTHERHNKFLHSKWRSMIYLKRCSLNAALSYIQLSDTTEDEEAYETSGSWSPIEVERLVSYPPAPAPVSATDAEIPESSSARSFFSCARLKRISNGEPEHIHKSTGGRYKWLYSISTSMRPFLKFLLRPLICKSLVEEHVSLLTTLTSGYLLRIFFDVLFYAMFLLMLFGAYETTESNQHVYLLYIYGRLLTFMSPCQNQEPPVHSLTNTFCSPSSFMSSVKSCNLSLSNLLRITKLDSTSTGLASVLVQNYTQLQHFHVFLGALLCSRILLILLRAFMASRKSRMIVSTRAVLLVKLMKEHPILYRLVQSTRYIINVIDIVSGSVLILIKTFILYEYFRSPQGRTISDFVFFFLLILITWSSIPIELSPLCNTSTGATLSLYTHICANTIFFLDSKDYVALVLRAFKELRYVWLIISYYIFNSLHKTANSHIISNATNMDTHLLTQDTQAISVPEPQVMCLVQTNYASILRAIRDEGSAKTIWGVYRVIRQKFPHCDSHLIAYLSSAFSKADVKQSESVTYQTFQDTFFLANKLPSIRNLRSGIYFLCVICCIMRVVFSQLDLYQAMINHVTQGIFIYSETKKLIRFIAYNKLEKIFFDLYLHTISSFCNILTYQAECIHKSINMNRNFSYIGRQLKLVGLTSDLIYDSEIQLPCSAVEGTDINLLKRVRTWPLAILYFLPAKLLAALHKGSAKHKKSSSAPNIKTQKLNGDVKRRSSHSPASVHISSTANQPDKKITSVASFANIHDCYDISKSLESLFTERSTNSPQPPYLYSKEELHQIIKLSKFSSWRKYAVFRSCYNSCNFSFRYLYDLDTLKLVLANKFSMKICDENMYAVKPDTVFEPYYSKTLAGILRALLAYKDRRFNTMPSPFLFIPPSYMLCIAVTELYDAIVEEGAHITLLKYMSLLKIINDTVACDSNLLYIQKDLTFYIIYNSPHLSKFSSIHTVSDPMDCYTAIFYLCKIAYSIKKLFLWELEKRFYTQTFRVFGYINLHHELNICLVGRRLNRLDILDITALHERIRSIALICGPFDIVIQDELYKIAKEVHRMGTSTRGMLNMEIDEAGIYKKLLNIGEGI